jgi:phospholipid/cholesterol/gamma-HCH transport system permease protein
MLEWMRQLGRGGFKFFEKLGRGNLFLSKTLAGVPSVLARPGLLVAQLLSVGVLSFLIITVSGLFVGMVLALQGYNTLVDFGAEESRCRWCASWGRWSPPCCLRAARVRP